MISKQLLNVRNNRQCYSYDSREEISLNSLAPEDNAIVRRQSRLRWQKCIAHCSLRLSEYGTAP